MAEKKVIEWRWEPFPGPQTATLQRGEKEVLFGGGRGSGKTELGIIWAAIPALERDSAGLFRHPYYRGLVLRRHAEDLSDWILRADQIYSKFGAKKVGRPPEFRFPSGAVIRTGHLRDADAYTKYQGHEYSRVVIEELQLIASERLYEQLMGSCRSRHPDLRPQLLLTANPGGPGTKWIRDRFVKVYAPDGRRIEYGEPFKVPKTGEWRIYIPANIEANPALAKNDPGYVAYLESLPDALKKAWRYGDWDAIQGQFFSEFRAEGPLSNEPPWASHVIPKHAFQAEPWWHRWMSGDWGYDHPSVFHWYALDPAIERVYAYREMRVRKMSETEVGARLAEATAPDLDQMPTPHITVALDPMAWRKVGEGKAHAQLIRDGIEIALGKGTAWLQGESTENEMPAKTKPAIILRQADNQRIPGWAAVREMLRWQPLFGYHDGLPQWRMRVEEPLPRLQIVGEACPYLIDTLGIMVFSEAKPEDAEKIDAIDGVGGDDAADSLRYGIQAYRLQKNSPPLEAVLNRRLNKLREQHGGVIDPTAYVMVTRHVIDQYNKQNLDICPVTFARSSSRRIYERKNS